MTSPKRAAGREGCGCWAAVARGLRGACFRPAAPADGDGGRSAKGSHVHDAAETRYLNASNREPGDHFRTKHDGENGVDASIEKRTPKLLQFTFQELKSATLNFRPDSILGEGGFGYVFKGWIEPNSTAPAKPGTGVTVAVKSLKPDALQGHREWVAEVDFLGQLHHKHLVKLIGYCIEDDQRLLVYEFMARGSLENHLLSNKGEMSLLNWPKRLRIIQGIADGLAYLHGHPQYIVHRDMKAGNILLDHEMNPKITDFGIAVRLVPSMPLEVDLPIVGTRGYADPEYIATGKISKKQDVYGFGIVLLEIIGGKLCNSYMSKEVTSLAQALPEYARKYQKKPRKLVDPFLRAEEQGMAQIIQCVEVALLCIRHDARCRPTMSEIVTMLANIRAVQP